MTITNRWKLFRCGVKRDHYEKLISIREFSERLAQDNFNNKLSYDRGTPAKNIPPLDDVNDEDTVSTCRVLQFCSCISPSASVSTISDMTQNSASTISIGSEHFSEKEEAKLRGRYNRLTRGYCLQRFPNVNRCLQRSLWFFNGCNVFNKKRMYYCQQVHHNCFEMHHGSLVHLP